MGLVNLPTGMVHFDGKLVGKYTGFWDNLFAYVSEAILCEELIPDESTLEELTEWAKENKLPMRFREGRLATDHWWRWHPLTCYSPEKTPRAWK